MTWQLANYFPYIIGVIVIVVLFGVVAGGNSKSNDAHYDRIESLLSVAEMNFYQHVLVAAPEDCVVFSKVRMAVELDDKSHNTQKTKARDAFVNAACASAQLPLLRVKAAKNYDSGDLSEKVAAHLSGSAIS